MLLRVILILLYTFSLFIAGADLADAKVRVKGYYRSDGTYVRPHYRSSPDSSPYNNWSYPGNVNPYTGKVAPGNPGTYLNNYYNQGPTYPVVIPPTPALPSAPVTPPSPNNYIQWKCSPGFFRYENVCLRAPQNASVDSAGMGWSCNWGYVQSGPLCNKIMVPQHAALNGVGNGWVCNPGFARSEEKCVPVAQACGPGTFKFLNQCAPLPLYAKAKPGGGWECFRGFVQTIDACVLPAKQNEKAIAIPAAIEKPKAAVTASCEPGFFRFEHHCWPLPANAHAKPPASWACNDGFVERNFECIRAEPQRQAQQETKPRAAQAPQQTAAAEAQHGGLY